MLLVATIILTREMVDEARHEAKVMKEPIWTSARISGMVLFYACGLALGPCAVGGRVPLARFFRPVGTIVDASVGRELRTLAVKILASNAFLFCLCLAHGLVANLLFLGADLRRMVQVFFFFLFLFLMNLFSCQFVLLAHLVRFLYKRTNEMLSRGCRGSEAVDLVKRLRARDSILKDASQAAASVHAPFLLLYLSWIFLFVVHGFMYVVFTNFSILNLFLWFVYYYVQIIFILAACTSASEQAEKTANYLHELFIDNDDPELKEEIEIFSLQLLHRKVEFNACGFFKLDFSLLYSMVGAVTTYIIILMQFQGSHEPNYGNCISNCTTCSPVQ